MREVRYRTKKRFGQHFLHERKYIDDILSAAAIRHGEAVLEIGPGLGALTDRLLECSGQLVVMELDRDLVERLDARNDPRLVVHQGDVLSLDWPQLLASPPYVLVANLPYNISSQILFKLLEHRDLFSRAVLMFQKEVGDRICAPPDCRDYGVLSVLCQFYFDVSRVVTVPPGAFSPPPRVESVVLSLRPLASSRHPLDNELMLRKVVKAAFGQRRKTLRNALQATGFDALRIESALSSAGIDPGRRGETLSLQEFAVLSNRFAGRDFHL